MLPYEEARTKAYEVTHYPLSVKFLDACADMVWVKGNSPYSKEGLYTLHSMPTAGCCSQTEALILNQICKIIKPIVTIEIGSYIGWSTVHLAEHSRHVYAVDNFSEGAVEEIFLSNIRKLGFTNIELVNQPSDKYLASIVAEPMYDIIFIDGYHHNGQPLKDSIAAIRLLKNDGIILLHDTWEKDVRLAGDYLITEGFSEHIFDTDNWLGIYSKDRDKLAWLLEMLRSSSQL